MSTEYKFEGWMGDDASSSEGKMVWRDFEPKPWEETDVDIRVTHCGVCGSDVHVLRSGWVSLSSRYSYHNLASSKHSDTDSLLRSGCHGIPLRCWT